jgi:hypothetical protein
MAAHDRLCGVDPECWSVDWQITEVFNQTANVTSSVDFLFLENGDYSRTLMTLQDLDVSGQDVPAQSLCGLKRIACMMSDTNVALSFP